MARRGRLRGGSGTYSLLPDHTFEGEPLAGGTTDNSCGPEDGAAGHGNLVLDADGVTFRGGDEAVLVSGGEPVLDLQRVEQAAQVGTPCR